jgi:hypothetical protein
MIEQRKASRMSRPKDENSGTMDKLSTAHALIARKCANSIASGAAKPPSLPTASVRCGQMPQNPTQLCVEHSGRSLQYPRFWLLIWYTRRSPRDRPTKLVGPFVVDEKVST